MKAVRSLRTGGLLLALVLVAGCGGEEITPPKAHGDDGDRQAAAATTTLAALQRGLRDHDRAAVTALAASDRESQAAVAAIYANAAALRLSRISLHYVDADDSAPPGRLDSYGSAAFAATVTVAWQIPGYDAEPAHEDTRFVFVESGGRARLADVGGGGDRTPLWLAEPLTVVRQPHSLVMVSTAVRSPVGELAAEAEHAVADVRRVLPRWRGRLVVEVPGSESALEEVLGAKEGAYAAIAGTTTPVDGSLVRGSPVHVYLNPDVFEPLGARGRQVVLSHETTHVATGAPFSRGVPTWLLEGFADYVALVHSDVPLHLAARQVFARVRHDGPPTSLPTSDDLSASAPGLGATYEEAWTVCRYFAEQYGEAALVAFYDRVNRGMPVEAAFRRAGTTQAAFVKAWSADLDRIARAS